MDPIWYTIRIVATGIMAVIGGLLLWAAYLVSGSDRELLCRPLIEKRFWYETWLALKEKHGDLPQFIRQPGGRTK